MLAAPGRAIPSLAVSGVSSHKGNTSDNRESGFQDLRHENRLFTAYSQVLGLHLARLSDYGIVP